MFFFFLGWDSPLDLVALGAGNKSDHTPSSSEATPIWGLMPPEMFQPMEVPFDLQGPVEGIVCAIPPLYLRALATRKEWVAGVVVWKISVAVQSIADWSCHPSA